MVPECLGFRGYERSDVLRESEAARRRRPGQRRACAAAAAGRARTRLKTRRPPAAGAIAPATRVHTFPNLSSNDKPRQENRGSPPRIFAQSLRRILAEQHLALDKIDSCVEPPLIEDQDVFVHVCCTRFLYPNILPISKNVYSSRLVSTLAITTHRSAARIAQGLSPTRRQARQWRRAERSPAGVRNRDHYGDYMGRTRQPIALHSRPLLLRLWMYARTCMCGTRAR